MDIKQLRICNDIITGYTQKLAEDEVIPEGIVGIGEGALCNCFELESIVLPVSLKNIGNYAFGG